MIECLGLPVYVHPFEVKYVSHCPHPRLDVQLKSSLSSVFAEYEILKNGSIYCKKNCFDCAPKKRQGFLANGAIINRYRVTVRHRLW